MHNFNFNWLILAVCNKSSGMKIRSCFACNQLIENPLSAENTREPLLETNFISVPSSRSRVQSRPLHSKNAFLNLQCVYIYISIYIYIWKSNILSNATWNLDCVKCRLQSSLQICNTLSEVISIFSGMIKFKKHNLWIGIHIVMWNQYK